MHRYYYVPSNFGYRYMAPGYIVIGNYEAEALLKLDTGDVCVRTSSCVVQRNRHLETNSTVNGFGLRICAVSSMMYCSVFWG